MKGEKKMKRFLCLVMFVCLIVSCAYADNESDFNEYAMTFGSLPLLETMATTNGDYKIYEFNGCKVTFKGEERIFVQGDGIDFLAYCLSAIMTFEQDSTLKDNSGLLFAFYLLSRDGTQQSWTTPGGLVALVQQDGQEYLFAIGE